MNRRLFVALAAALLVNALVPARADSAEPVDVRVREASIDPSGPVRLVVSVSGATATPAFTVREQGAVVDGVVATPLEAAQQPVAVVLAVDVSGSTAGRALADAKTGAKAFLDGLPTGARAALIAFGPAANVIVAFTTDRGALARAIDGLAAAGETALYDAVALAAATVARAQAQPNVVVFTDGKDTTSRATLAAAVTAAKDAKTPVTTIGLRTADLDTAALRALAERTGGRTLSVGGSAGLADAFRSAARDIASQYVLTYTGSARGGDLEIVVDVVAAGARATDRIVALNPRTAPAPPAPALPAPAPPLVPAFTTPVGLYVGLGTAFAAALMLGLILFRRPKRNDVHAALQRGLRLYVRGPARAKRAPAPASGAGAIARRAAELIDRVPKPPQYEERLQAKIDRGGWPFRAAELVAIRVGAALGGIVVGAVLLGRWWLAALFAVAGLAIPGVLLARRIASRQSAFLAQLPDTLQLLAGSLQAGYGFLQAIDTLVKESPPPTSGEFSRVLTETRLGMPVEDALNAMADRLGSEDFRWVVMAINIQRQVGGNLAQLLRTVADTLRERERVRRQIKVLSAEGRLSAYILGSLPFGIAGYIAMVNPGFLQTMTGDPLGRVMIGGALVMLGLGIVWMRKIIRIEV